MTAQQSASEWSGRGRPAASLDFLALGRVGYAGSPLENRSALIPRLRQPSLGMTQSLLKRKFLATQLGHRRRDGGNTTSYVAAALTLTPPWTGRGIGKWTPRRNQKIHRLGIEQLRVLEGRVLDLIVEVAALVVADEVGADVLVAGTLGRLGLIFETTEKGLCNSLFEVDARVLINHLLSQIFRKVLITDTQHIESDTVVQKLHLERLVRCDARSGVQRDCVPGYLNTRRRNVVVLKELASGIGAVYLEPVIIAAELLQQTEIMKRGADEQQLSIERLPCLPSQLIGPEEDPMRVVEEQRRAELVEEPGYFPSQLRVWNLWLYFLEL